MGHSLIARLRPLLRPAVPAALATALVRARSTRGRLAAAGSLVALWTAVHVRYRRAGRARTAEERARLAATDWNAFHRYYRENDDSIEEAFAIWGPYHQHRHEMRYDLVAGAVLDHLPPGGAVLDVGCGGALVADRIGSARARYVGVDVPSEALRKARVRPAGEVLTTSWGQAAAEHLPFADASFDVVVFSEVIEHLLRPELAVWEISRVLRPGGVLVMTTNNASEVPDRSPATHLFAWLEKAVGATHPRLVSLRPWVWPAPIDPSLLPPGAPPAYLAHTHHIFGETRDLFAAAGLHTRRWSTFEFPPPQSRSSAVLERWGATGRRLVDVVEAVARRLPLVRRLGCHLLVVATKAGPPVAPAPPAGVWPGPFSG